MALVQVDGKFEDRWRKLTEYAEKIMFAKRKLRGTGNIQRQGLQGIITRISEDKLERVRRFAENNMLRRVLKERGLPDATIYELVGPMDAEEMIGVEDDLFDIANYCMIAVLVLRDKWEDGKVPPGEEDVPF